MGMLGDKLITEMLINFIVLHKNAQFPVNVGDLREYITWHVAHNKARIAMRKDEIVACAFGWRVPNPVVIHASCIPNETEKGDYLYCPLVVLHKKHRVNNKRLINELIYKGLDRYRGVKFLAFHRKKDGYEKLHITKVRRKKKNG